MDKMIEYLLCYSLSFCLGVLIGMIFAVWAMKAFNLHEYDDV